MKAAVLPDNILRRMSPEDRKPIGKAGLTTVEANGKYSARQERELQEQIASLLRQRNIWFNRQRMDKRTTSTVGCPDFLFPVNGWFCAIEVKLPGCAPTDPQKAALAQLKHNGAFVAIVGSLTEARDFLNQAEKLRP